MAKPFEPSVVLGSVTAQPSQAGDGKFKVKFLRLWYGNPEQHHAQGAPVPAMRAWTAKAVRLATTYTSRHHPHLAARELCHAAARGSFTSGMWAALLVVDIPGKVSFYAHLAEEARQPQNLEHEMNGSDILSSSEARRRGSASSASRSSRWSWCWSPRTTSSTPATPKVALNAQYVDNQNYLSDLHRSRIRESAGVAKGQGCARRDHHRRRQGSLRPGAARPRLVKGRCSAPSPNHRISARSAARSTRCWWLSAAAALTTAASRRNSSSAC